MRKLLVAVCLLALAPAARADDVTFSTPDINLSWEPYVQTGYFDILISDSADSNTTGGAGDTPTAISDGYGPGVTNTNGSDLISGVTAEVETSGALTFIAADDNTDVGAVNAASYLYTGNSYFDNPYTGTVTDPPGLVGNQLADMNDVPAMRLGTRSWPEPPWA